MRSNEQSHKRAVGIRGDQKRQLSPEEVARVGLRRAGSECSSDTSEFASAQESTTARTDKRPYNNNGCRNLKGDNADGNEPRQVTSKRRYEQTSLDPGGPHLNESHGLPVSDRSLPGKIKFLCSFGGKILPRPSDGKLRYVGGDTRIISTGKNVSWKELMKKLSAICKKHQIVKYQLPGEDLDSLVSVSSDEDLENMLEEYLGFEQPGGFQRIRIFLLPLSENADSCNFHTSTIQENDPEYHYVIAVNGMAEIEPSPSKNCGRQSLPGKVSHLTPNAEQDSLQNESFVSSHASGILKETVVPRIIQNISESQKWIRCPNPSSSFSAVLTTHQRDLKNDFLQLGKDKLSLGTAEGIRSSPVQLPHPTKPSRDHNLIRNDSPLIEDLTEGHASRRAKPLLYDESSSHMDEKAEKLGSSECSGEKEMQQACNLQKSTEPDQSESVAQVKGASSNVFSTRTDNQVTGAVELNSPSTSATGYETIVQDSVSEGDCDSGGSYDDFVTDARIAEMEAQVYGLQIIRNADLEEIRELGSGTYGTVYHGKWRGTDVAIKRIKKTCISEGSSEKEPLIKDFWREARILSNLHHPNIVAFYGVVPDGEEGTLATVTEYMSNGSLKNSLLKKDRSLDCPRRLMVALDAAFGMEYLHSKNIIHFDVKCENFLVNLWDPQRPICKVGDFGLSRIKHNTLLSGGVRGTLPWMAPELLNGNTDQVTEKVDVFSFGIAMWEILTGKEPYADMHCGAIISGIVKNNLRPPVPEECDPHWRKLMEECWLSEPEARPSFSEITRRLREMCVNLLARRQSNLARQKKKNISM